MRYADIVRLAIEALLQQKTRTLLTTLGVIFGSFVLAASLSIGEGVQETIERQSRRSTHLREVRVRPQWGSKSGASHDEIVVQGNMSAPRRQRIRDALVDRKLRFSRGGPRVTLTRERLRSLAEIEHVEQVVPSVRMYGWASLDSHAHGAEIMSAKPDEASLHQRLLAGQHFTAASENAALVSELLLYQLGLPDDAALDAVLGKTLRLEIRAESFGAGLAIYLLKPDGADVTSAETGAIDKIKKQLPELIDHFELAAAEKDSLRKALTAAPPRAAETYAADFTIRGVFRLPTPEDIDSRWDHFFGDVVIPADTAKELFFRAPAQSERGIDEAALFVDHEQNVKEVVKRVKEMDLEAFGAMDYIERERLMYLLIFGAMTCVAGVAMLVAALGIANTMLMSVLERTREVGIMKAVGAASGHIQLIFLVEGAIIGIVGGALGLLLGWAASIPCDSWVRGMVSRDMKVELKESLFVFPPWLVLVVMAFAVGVTTLAAVYPARRAARVNPVTALRHE